jgi:hypothetical protein
MSLFGRRGVLLVDRGLAGHDSIALEKVRNVLLLLAEDSGEFPTWLVVSGDLTTWGEHAQLEEALRWIEGLAGDCGFQKYVMYGNHDVWAEHLPIETPETELTQNRTRMRETFFSGRTWPEVLELARAGEGLYTIQLCALNTIRHEALPNLLAWGDVDADWYWDSRRKADSTQLSEALNEIRSNSDGRLRIVVTHHPVHDPADVEMRFRDFFSAPLQSLRRLLCSVRTNRLRNAESVAAALPGRRPNPRCRIVLSGHLHKLFPKFGELPEGLPMKNGPMRPLTREQVQLIVGSASQALVSPNDNLGQTFQVLRFYADKNLSDQIRMERIVYARDNGLGEFEPICEDGDERLNVEEMYV